jgi:aminopeptidase N
MPRIAAWFLAAALAATLCCGHAAAGPRFSFATTPGKLPKEVVPRHYALRIAPSPAKDRFDGRAEIDIEVTKPVLAIVLNAVELRFVAASLRGETGQEAPLAVSIDAVREIATLAPASAPIAPGKYRLRIEYSGAIGAHPQGLYRIDYRLRDRGQLLDKAMLATQMEPTQARRLFPGWDEPAFRASFEITAVVDSGASAVSNMPVSKISELPDGKKEVAFEPSLPMASYLVALFVGEMETLEDGVDGIRLAIHTVKGKRESARYAMQATREIVHHYNEYFGERYPLAKLDQVALPGGMNGAMENWGAIAYNEGIFLYDAARDSQRRQQAVYGVIAHEIAHQWFGDLVTMAWWDDLWLNEGFATWLADKTADRFNPQWNLRLRGALAKDWALSEDARSTTHAIQTPVENEARAMEIFDSITYVKGAALLRMLETYLGEDVFREGVRRYVRAHRYGSATTADLWHELSQASGRDVGALSAPWTEQPGYPIVMVERRCTAGVARLTLAQERFVLLGQKAQPFLWKVPVILDAAGHRRTLLLEGASQELQIDGCGAVRANTGDTGYFRVQYDPENFRELASALPQLDAPDRLRLLSDTFALVQAGRVDVTRYLSLVDALGDETERSIWEQIMSALGMLRGLLDAPEQIESFDRYIIRVLQRPFARLGWEAKPGESADAALLRRSLIEALGMAGDAQVVREAQARFAARATRRIDPGIHAAVMNIVGRYADDATFEALLRQMREATDAGVRWEAQSALRHVREPKLVQRYMALLLTNELPPSDAVRNLTQLGAESDRPALVWGFVLENLSSVLAKASPQGRASVLPDVAAPFHDVARADELLALTKTHFDASALYRAQKSADWIRLKAEVKAREAQRAVAWARAHSDAHAEAASLPQSLK